MNSTRSRGISERNRSLLTTLHRSVRGPFTVQEAAEALSFDIPRTQRFLAYLADRGWLVRVQRGLYAPVSLDTVRPSEWREDPWVIAAKLFGPAFYLGGWTACEHWGLTEQIFRETVVVTTRKLRSKEMEVQGYSFRIKRTNRGNIFGTKTEWRSQTKVYVSDPSRTIADLLDDPSLGGGIRHVAEVLGTYLESEYRDDSLLADYIDRVGNRTAFKRLGYLLETLGVPAPDLLETSKDRVSTGVSLLDPTMPAKGHALRRWNLRVNATIPPERAAS